MAARACLQFRPLGGGHANAVTSAYPSDSGRREIYNSRFARIFAVKRRVNAWSRHAGIPLHACRRRWRRAGRPPACVERRGGGARRGRPWNCRVHIQRVPQASLLRVEGRSKPGMEEGRCANSTELVEPQLQQLGSSNQPEWGRGMVVAAGGHARLRKLSLCAVEK